MNYCSQHMNYHRGIDVGWFANSYIFISVNLSTIKKTL